MNKDANELNRWVTKLQRKLDSMPLTKLDREELEEISAIIVNLAQRQMVADKTPATPQATKSKKNGGE